MFVYCACGGELEISHVKLDQDYDSEINVLECPDCAQTHQDALDAKDDEITDAQDQAVNEWNTGKHFEDENTELRVALDAANDDITGLRTELNDLEQELAAARQTIEELQQ